MPDVAESTLERLRDREEMEKTPTALLDSDEDAVGIVAKGFDGQLAEFAERLPVVGRGEQ